MRLTVVVQNLQHGGLADESGAGHDRWPLLRERLTAAEPDVLILNEARGWAIHDHALLGRAMTDLGLYAAPVAHTPNDLPSVILIRWDTMGPWCYTNQDLSEQTVHGFSTVSVAVAGLSQPITFAGAHINPYSSSAAIAEAELVATRAYRKGCLAVLGGDINYPPLAGPEPKYEVMLPFNKASRTLPTDEGTGLRPNRQIAQAIARRGYVDAALHLYDKTGDERLLRPTASDDRIDQIHVSAPLGDALTRYQVLDVPAGASDHHGVLVEMDTDLVRHDLMWAYR